MPQTLPLSFEDVLAEEKRKLLRHDTKLLLGFGPTDGEALASAGFVELEVAPFNHGHGRWTYAQYVMTHALTKAGWTRKQTAAAIGKSRNAVIGLLYRETPWRTATGTRAGLWSRDDTDAVVSLRDMDKRKWRDIAKAVGWSECYCRLRYREAKNQKPEEPHSARV